MKTLGYIGAFLGGSIAGALLGIALAPESGKDTRKKVVDVLSDFCDKHNINLSRKDVSNLAEEITESVEEAVS